MKKSLLILTFALFVCVGTKAQTFKLTPEGFVSVADPAKNYAVFEYSGKNAAELYKSSLLYFNAFYVSPKDVISTVEGESITINGFSEKTVRQNGTATPFDINYTITFLFKDGKIRINSPSFNATTGLRKMYLVYTGFSMDGTEIGVYGKGGKVKLEKAIEDLENFFNVYIDKYNKGISTKSDW
ncbi:MAG: DUF4468 domain-containing protein [Oligoflexus sp.]|nr:DUF4468 domain-containing protein [Pseudopedobacter sp.]